jgi:hypothetical protein
MGLLFLDGLKSHVVDFIPNVGYIQGLFQERKGAAYLPEGNRKLFTVQILQIVHGSLRVFSASRIKINGNGAATGGPLGPKRAGCEEVLI